jgi:hypothetical protein
MGIPFAYPAPFQLFITKAGMPGVRKPPALYPGNMVITRAPALRVGMVEHCGHDMAALKGPLSNHLQVWYAQPRGANEHSHSCQTKRNLLKTVPILDGATVPLAFFERHSSNFSDTLSPLLGSF